MEDNFSSFKGMLYEPILESEVILLFGLMIPHLPDSFVIDQGDFGQFPDCYAFRNNVRIGIEFELYSKHFLDHNHQNNPLLRNCARE